MSNNKFCNTELPQKSLSAVVNAELANKTHNEINMQIKENHDYFFKVYCYSFWPVKIILDQIGYIHLTTQ